MKKKGSLLVISSTKSLRTGLFFVLTLGRSVSRFLFLPSTLDTTAKTSSATRRRFERPEAPGIHRDMPLGGFVRCCHDATCLCHIPVTPGSCGVLFRCRVTSLLTWAGIFVYMISLLFLLFRRIVCVDASSCGNP